MSISEGISRNFKIRHKSRRWKSTNMHILIVAQILIVGPMFGERVESKVTPRSREKVILWITESPSLIKMI